MASKNLIALVALHLIVDGQRVVVEPGESVPELSPHDEQELLYAEAIQDQKQVDATAKAQATADREAMGEFNAARKRVQAKAASTASVTPK